LQLKNTKICPKIDFINYFFAILTKKTRTKVKGGGLCLDPAPELPKGVHLLGDHVPPLGVVAYARLQVALKLGDSMLELESGGDGSFLRKGKIFIL
jgi:hypothetical protein